MSSIFFNTEYEKGEYYNPLDILKILKLKYSHLNWRILFFPIRLLIFIPLLIFSIINFPIFIFTKLFFRLNKIGENYIIIELIMWFINIFYFISYYIYKTILVVINILCFLYQKIPPCTYYISQTSVFKDDDL